MSQFRASLRNINSKKIKKNPYLYDTWLHLLQLNLLPLQSLNFVSWRSRGSGAVKTWKRCWGELFQARRWGRRIELNAFSRCIQVKIPVQVVRVAVSFISTVSTAWRHCFIGCMSCAWTLVCQEVRSIRVPVATSSTPYIQQPCHRNPLNNLCGRYKTQSYCEHSFYHLPSSRTRQSPFFFHCLMSF